MKIVVTGGAGFIGSHVVDAYLKAGHEVTVIDDFSTGKRENLGNEGRVGLTVREGDIRDLDFLKSVMTQVRPDVVSHHAAQVSVAISSMRPLDDLTLNVLGTVNILEAVRTESPQSKVIYSASGGTMYGVAETLPTLEDTPASPTSPYGLSKYTAERYVWLYADIYGLRATVLRYGNVYGPRQDPHGEVGVCAIFTERMLHSQPVTVFGDGTPLRDYIFVSDVAAANTAALREGDGEAFNIGTGRGTSTNEVFRTLSGATGYVLEARYEPLRPGELMAVSLSVEKAASNLDWSPQVDFTEGVRQTVEWYRQYRS
ncbi:MAG: NAD-dependent epimerase/dehydratase family protein [bacterium]